MQFIDDLWTKLTGQLVGHDKEKNAYYESYFSDYLGRKHRNVVYKHHADPSTISPDWYMWIHHMSDKTPINEKKKHKWQSAYEPNPTGTKMAYKPLRKKVSAEYQKWQPNR